MCGADQRKKKTNKKKKNLFAADLQRSRSAGGRRQWDIKYKKQQPTNSATKKQIRKSGVDSPFLSFGGVIDNGSSITPKLTVFSCARRHKWIATDVFEYLGVCQRDSLRFLARAPMCAATQLSRRR
jgi:hypothetical protein